MITNTATITMMIIIAKLCCMIFRGIASNCGNCVIYHFDFDTNDFMVLCCRALNRKLRDLRSDILPSHITTPDFSKQIVKLLPELYDSERSVMSRNTLSPP